MTDKDRAEIERLSGEAHEARERWRWAAQMNTAGKTYEERMSDEPSKEDVDLVARHLYRAALGNIRLIALPMNARVLWRSAARRAIALGAKLPKKSEA